MMGRNPYLTNTSIKQDIAIAEQALNEVDAYQFKDRLFLTLSGGEQQRVQLARVLTQIWEQQDAILFLDEPTSALDLKHQHQILELARILSVEKLMTVICILHDINLATHYTDQAILMLDGEIYKNGNSKEMLCTENIQHVYQLSDTIIDKFHSYNPQTA